MYFNQSKISIMYILLLQNIPTYPGAHPFAQSPFDELQGRLFKQCPLHCFSQSFTFSQSAFENILSNLLMLIHVQVFVTYSYINFNL